MVLCFILFGLLIGIAVAFVCINDNWGEGLVAIILAIVILLIGCSVSDSKANKRAVEVLSDLNIEYLSDEEVYNTSKADLDKLYKVSTLTKNYYYNLEETKE